jgi:predicted phosphodiesterase
VSHHQKNYTINRHILGFVGDIIGGFIHEELMQTNSMTPLEAISFAKTTIMSGLKFLNDNLNVDNIDVVCVVGNHGRTTKKIQHSNRTETSYEYFLYKDLEIMCKTLGLNKINFIIPKSSIVMIEVLGKKLAFTHGDNFKYIGGIGGLYVPLLKYIAKLKSTFEIDMLFFGHYHTTVFIKEAIGNGSIKGYDAYSMNKGFSYEPPQQSLVLLNETRGFTNYQPIFLD